MSNSNDDEEIDDPCASSNKDDDDNDNDVDQSNSSRGQGGGEKSQSSAESHAYRKRRRTPLNRDGINDTTKRQRTSSTNTMSSSSNVDDSGSTNNRIDASTNYRNSDGNLDQHQQQQSGSSVDDQSTVMHMLSQELADVEAGLTQQRSVLFDTNLQPQQGAGRQIFDSIGSALGNIRNRLQNMTSSSTSATTTGGGSSPAAVEGEAAGATSASISTSTTPATTATTLTSSSPPASAGGDSRRCCSRNRSSLAELSHRLQTAERAYSTRMPLGLLQNEMAHHRRRRRRRHRHRESASDDDGEHFHGDDDDEASHHSAPAAVVVADGGGVGEETTAVPVPTIPGVAAFSTEHRSLSDIPPLSSSRGGKSDVSNDDEETLGMGATPTRRRRSSLLVASRRRSEQNLDSSSHHSPLTGTAAAATTSSSIGSPRPPAILEKQESNLSSSSALASSLHDSANSVDNKEVQEAVMATQKDDDCNDDGDKQEEEEEGVEVELLLPESTREQLDAAGNHLHLTGSLRILSQSTAGANMMMAPNAVEMERDVESTQQSETSAMTTTPTTSDTLSAAATATTASSNYPPLYTWGSLEFEILSDSGKEEETTAQKASYRLFGSNDTSCGSNVRTYLQSPEKIPPETRLGRSHIVSSSISETHMAFCTNSGRILACGDNTLGAVDPSQRLSAPTIPRPTHLELLAMHRIIKVACGKDHTVAITENRAVLSWGSNEYGQLGHRLPPSGNGSSVIRNPATMQFKGRASNVACGNGFSLVLTTRMQVFMCGREEISGYDATTTTEGSVRLPEQHPALDGLPLVYVAAGDFHAVVLTAHGTAYAWGSNGSGQCGREYPRQVKVPGPVTVPTTSRTTSGGSSTFANWDVWEKGTPVSLADDVNIVHAACGSGHTVLVTKTGRLLVCGSNASGQLGLANTSLSSVTSVQEVRHQTSGRKFEFAEAGTSHTLLLDDVGGVSHTSINGEIQVVSSSTLPKTQHIFAGGSMSMALGKHEVETLPHQNPTMPGLDDLLEAIRIEHETAMQGEGSSDSSNGSLAEDLSRRTEELFRCPGIMNSLFMDPKEIEDLYQKLIHGGHNHDVQQQMVKAMEIGMIQALKAIKGARLMYPEAVRFLLLFLQCPLLREERPKLVEDDNTKSKDETLADLQFDVRGEMLLLLCETILGMPFEGYKAFIGWAVTVYGEELFVPYLVRPLVVQLNNRVERERTRAVPAIAGVLRWFETAAKHSQYTLARAEDFHCVGIEQLPMESLFQDLHQWNKSTKIDRASTFFLAANAFLMSPQLKRELLQIENQVGMMQAAQMGGVNFDPRTREFQFNPYFVLTLDRQYLLQQTLQAVAQASPTDLKKSLKIVFKGEDGVDAGGVTKEFFQILVQKLFDPNTGMWTTRLGDGTDTWFNSDCTWNDDGFYLTGILCGLALYNGVLLDMTFPPVVYRKLLGLPLGLEDMVDEDVQRGLQQLLDYDGDDVEDVFCLNFQVNWTSLGTERKRDLKPGGAKIPVTSENKEEYTLAYVKWVLVDSIAQQYDEFERGFMAVMKGSSLDLLRPEELELLVVGTRELDFAALEEAAKYEGGFDTESAVVKNLWRFVKSSTPDEQLHFLKFATGSGKAPIGGLGKLPFLVQRAGPDSTQLPTSHTCFNTLLLPDYGDDYEKLADRLGIAIRECQGFGLQ